jgi:hypothetical protein
MEIIKLYKPSESENYCVTDLFTPEQMKEFGISVVRTPEEADVIVASWMRELQPFVRRFVNTKRYLLWNCEPIWMAHEHSTGFTPRVYAMAENVGQIVPIHVMSISTRDAFPDNYFFLDAKPEVVEKTLAEKPVFDGSNRKVVAVVTYRNAPQFAYRFNDSFYSINNERCRLALDGYMNGMVDIYGRDWPAGISKGDTRDDHIAGKPALLKPYFFNLCSENTVAPTYVTEKIWESVANGCLPIYHAGK